MTSNTCHKVIGSQRTEIAYEVRHAVLTIIEDPASRKIALIFVQKGQYYKLPGGGIEIDEDHTLTAEREALEETGCKVKVDENRFQATTEEWRNDLHQLSFCYVAEVLEDTGVANLTELEVFEGLKHEWIGVAQAIKKMEDLEPTSELGRFVKDRDLFFLTEYRKVSSPPFMLFGTKQPHISYETRHCVYVIIQNKKTNGIALLRAAPYYMLHGCEVDADVDQAHVAERIALDRVGCRVKVTGCLATAENWRSYGEHELSSCYAAELLEDLGVAESVDNGVNEGLLNFETIWIRYSEKMCGMTTSAAGVNLPANMEARDVFFLSEFTGLDYDAQICIHQLFFSPQE